MSKPSHTKVVYLPSDYCPCGANIFSDNIVVLKAGEYRTGTGGWTLYQCLECKRQFKKYWPKFGTFARKVHAQYLAIKGENHKSPAKPTKTTGH